MQKIIKTKLWKYCFRNRNVLLLPLSSLFLSPSRRQKAFVSYYFRCVFSPQFVDGENFFVPWYAMNLYAIQQSAFIGFLSSFFSGLICFTSQWRTKKELKETKIGLWPKNLIRRKILIYRSFFPHSQFHLNVHEIHGRFRAFNLCVNLSKEFSAKHLNSFSSTFAILLTLTCNLNQHKLSHPQTISDFFILFLLPPTVLTFHSNKSPFLPIHKYFTMLRKLFSQLLFLLFFSIQILRSFWGKCRKRKRWIWIFVMKFFYYQFILKMLEILTVSSFGPILKTIQIWHLNSWTWHSTINFRRFCKETKRSRFKTNRVMPSN